MKILAAILLALIFSLSLFAQTTDIMTVAVKPQKANLRGTASATGKVVLEVVQGQVFDVLLKQGEWFLVQTPMFVGWLHQSVVTPKEYLPDLSAYEIKPTPQKTVETYSEPKYLSDPEDNGYDVGLVRSQTADLVDAQGKSLLRMSSNDELAVIKRPDSSEYVRVIHLETGRNGYVLKKNVSLYYTRKPKTSESPFSERRTGSYKNPEITVSNTTDRVLYLTVGSTELELASGTTRTITLEEGSYDFFASAANVRPLIGNKYYSKGIAYSWTFYIK
jgi:hypothetical protein